MALSEETLKSKIYTIRGEQVMLDKDLAELYGVETKRINEAVKNNKDKFQEDFYFQLTDYEFRILRSKFSTAKFSKTRSNPKVFTEQGVYMIATIIKSKVANQVTVSLIRTFADMKKLLLENTLMFQRFERIEEKLYSHDENFNKIFKAIEAQNIKPKQGIFFNGQIFEPKSQKWGRVKEKMIYLKH